MTLGRIRDDTHSNQLDIQIKPPSFNNSYRCDGVTGLCQVLLMIRHHRDFLLFSMLLSVCLYCTPSPGKPDTVRSSVKVRVACRVFSQNLVDERRVPSGPLERYR
eukprot:sb/3477896/